MKQATALFVLVLALGLSGCSATSSTSRSGIPVVFKGAPLITDNAVYYRGSVVGSVVSSEWQNGITRLIIAMDGAHGELIRTGMAAVVQYGRLQLVPLAGYGEPLPPSGVLLGFRSKLSYQWFRFKHLLGSASAQSGHEARALLIRSGMTR